MYNEHMYIEFFKPLVSKRLIINRIGFFKVLILSCLMGLSGQVEAASFPYLTCVDDPAHAMTVQWLSSKNDVNSVVYYQKAGESWWRPVVGFAGQVDGSDTWIHRVGLVGLDAGAEYAFKLGSGVEIFRFRTVPQDLSRPVKFAVGGDAYYGEGDRFREMNREIASQDPDFVVIGGDIAYSRGSWKLGWGKGGEFDRWKEFLKIWEEDMVAPDGRLIPMVVVPGNHDVPKKVNPAAKPLLFYELFSFPEKDISYRMLNAGSYLSLVLLDSDHTYPVEGKQTAWLEGALKEAKDRLYKMAVYHVSAYPAYYPYNGEVSSKIRKNWVPLFEAYGLQAAFEHHNHCYKRTFRLKNGKIDPAGIWYLGDGSWGVPPRNPRKEWYLEKAAAIDAYYLVTLEKAKAGIEPRTRDGKQVEAPIEILK